MRNKIPLIGVVLGLTITLTIGGLAAMYTPSANGVGPRHVGPGHGFHPGPPGDKNVPPIPIPCSGTGTITVTVPGGAEHIVHVPICNG